MLHVKHPSSVNVSYFRNVLCSLCFNVLFSDLRYHNIFDVLL